MEFDRRDRAGLVKRGHGGVLDDKESRALWGHVMQLERLLHHDEEEASSLVAREAAFLRQAIDNYGRCVLLGASAMAGMPQLPAEVNDACSCMAMALSLGVCRTSKMPCAAAAAAAAAAQAS